MDSPPWYFLWGVPATNDNESNGALDDDATLAANVFYASTLNVILQRLMPLYRLRQSGESMTLLPTATHIDIAAAMALKPTQFFRFSTPVILGLVPRIFWQQTPNQVNKLALLLHKEYAYTRLSGQAR